MKTTGDVIATASEHLAKLPGHVFDVLDVKAPPTPDAAENLAKIISKLSPLVGNLIEFNTCEYLNSLSVFQKVGRWKRQDPGFPDTVFVSKIQPTPGFEIKAWFPLATEITARFKDSQLHFSGNNTYVAMLAWLPEHVIYGRPKIVDIVVVSAASVAKARDDHYHNPPDYLVFEPEDTAARTQNLQQTNTNGFKFQGSPAELKAAEKIVASWGRNGKTYSTSREYQEKLKFLRGKFTYRLDTNFAKMDRIVHPEIEAFKSRVLSSAFHGSAIRDWKGMLGNENIKLDEAIAKALAITGRTTPVIK